MVWNRSTPPARLSASGSGILQRVVVINDDSIESGGAASIALASAKLLRQRNIPVTFLSGDSGSNSELRELGVDVVSLGGMHIMEGARGAAAVRGIFNARTRAALDHWINVHDTDGTAYHLHNWHKVLSPSVFSALRRVASRLTMSAHDYFLACPNGGYFNYPQQRPCELTPLGGRCVCTSCDRRHYVHKLWRVARHQVRQRLFDLRDTQAIVLAVHEGMVPYLRRARIAANAIRVLRNPVTPWRNTRIAAERNREVFFIGRLEEDKGVDLLANAARRANVPLRIIGDGPLAARLARDHREVTLMGRRSRDQIAELIGGARMVVVPTRWRETFGLVAFEALMSGVPVILSQYSLAADEVVQLGLGLSCDPHDEDRLTAAIARLSADDIGVREISCRAFSEARKLAPTLEEWGDSLMTLYESRVQMSAAAG
jgi:glycosyltransferase involved in cell wall biosynthesis